MDNQNIFFERLGESWYSGEHVVEQARSLLGKYLVTDFPEGRAVGLIVETEAYRGPDDRACHAWNNRCTARNRVMFEAGGVAYIYLCYGLHHLFNVVTGPVGMPHAVLIRALEPIENTALMQQRRKMEKLEKRLSAGPGILSQAMGISTSCNGQLLTALDSPIWIESRDCELQDEDIESGPRIGVSYAGTCALRPWRFWIKGSDWVSGIKSRKDES
jgi:DNA-3-methyladenine glycosylase